MFVVPHGRNEDAVDSRRAAQAKFDALATQWNDATAHLSSTTDRVLHPAYQAIVGMGDQAVPLLLNDLAAQPAHWFWALSAITGADPVPANARGRVPEMASAWLRWGRQNHYL